MNPELPTCHAGGLPLAYWPIQKLLILESINFFKMDKYIRYSAYAGIASLVLSILGPFIVPYLIFALASLAAGAETYGFYRIGAKEKLKLLKTISLILIVMSLIYFVLFLFSPEYVFSVENLILSGIVAIIFAASLQPLMKKFKTLVKAVIFFSYATGFLMAIGWLFSPIILIASFLTIVLGVLEIIFLYKASSKYK